MSDLAKTSLRPGGWGEVDALLGRIDKVLAGHAATSRAAAGLVPPSIKAEVEKIMAARTRKSVSSG